MNLKRVVLFTLFVMLVCTAAVAQTIDNSAEIYIKQSSDETTGLPVNRAAYNELLILDLNEIRSISLSYPDQDDLLTGNNTEDLQWGSNDLITDSELTFSVETESEEYSSEEAAGRMAELLSDMISNRSEERDSSGVAAAAGNDAMEAFRNAFKAVIEEDTGAEEEAATQEPVIYGDVEGIVLDETRSKTGRDFYNAFYDAWSKREGKENSVVRIAEKPGPGMGSIVYVEVDYEVIFELRLRPGDQRTRHAGDIAAARTLSYLEEKPNKPLIY
jgi:curli production assembly/transport component CsgE